MPPELLRTHRELDRAAQKLYGFSARDTEASIVARLMTLYQTIK
jgi:hypothetical protein